MEKKVYLKDIKDNKELLKQVFNNNEKLKEECYKDAYETNMDLQLEFSQLCMGKNNYEYIDIRDNYSSFYLVLKNSEKFIENIDKNYLSTEEEQLYNKAKELLEKRNNEEDTDKYYEFDNELDYVAEQLLKMLEKDLHTYEKIDEEQAQENFMFNLQNNMVYEDLYYYEEDDTYNLYEDISYTKNWN